MSAMKSVMRMKRGAVLSAALLLVALSPGVSWAAGPAKAKGGADAKATGKKAAGEKEKKKVNAERAMALGNKWAQWAMRTRDAKQARSALRRAARHYQRAVKAKPVQLAAAHYNLGQVYQALERCDRAAFHYIAYLGVGADEGTRDAAQQGLRGCVQGDWPKLTVEVTPAASARVRLDGFVIASAGKPIKALVLPPGDYEVEIEAKDHISVKRAVQLKRGAKETEVLRASLERMTFHGTFTVTVNVADARVRLVPKQLDKPDPSIKAMDYTTPPKAPVRLPTGKYLLEVTHKDHFRWIRHVYIKRDSESSTEVKLTKLPPPELR